MLMTPSIRRRVNAAAIREVGAQIAAGIVAQGVE